MQGLAVTTIDQLCRGPPTKQELRQQGPGALLVHHLNVSLVEVVGWYFNVV